MAKHPPISEQLRQAIVDSEFSQADVSRATGIKETNLSRFMNARGGLRLSGVDEVCELLGLELRPIPPNRQNLVNEGDNTVATVFKRSGASRKSPYYISWYDATGKRRTKSSGTSIHKDALEIAKKLESGVALERHGVIDSAQKQVATEGRRPLGEHVEDFRAHLQSKQNTPKHVGETISKIQTIIDGAAAKRFADLTAESVAKALDELQAGGLSANTCNHYLRAVKSFAIWMKQRGRITTNPLVGIAPRKKRGGDRERKRRVVSVGELRFLLATVESYAPSDRSLPGPDRAMFYRVAIGTGYRAGELRSLTRRCFRLDDSPPTVDVAANYTKARRDDSQPIREDLAKLLSPWLADKPHDVPLFAQGTRHTARTAKAGPSEGSCPMD